MTPRHHSAEARPPRFSAPCRSSAAAAMSATWTSTASTSSGSSPAMSDCTWAPGPIAVGRSRTARASTMGQRPASRSEACRRSSPSRTARRTLTTARTRASMGDRAAGDRTARASWDSKRVLTEPGVAEARRAARGTRRELPIHERPGPIGRTDARADAERDATAPRRPARDDRGGTDRGPFVTDLRGGHRPRLARALERDLRLQRRPEPAPADRALRGLRPVPVGERVQVDRGLHRARPSRMSCPCWGSTLTPPSPCFPGLPSRSWPSVTSVTIALRPVRRGAGRMQAPVRHRPGDTSRRAAR